jgi:hypothetical protein
LTLPGLGAFAMTTNVRPMSGEWVGFSLEDSIAACCAKIYADRGIPALRRRK